MAKDFDGWLSSIDDDLEQKSVDLAPHKAAIAKIESGGRYDALGPIVTYKDGRQDRGYGKYQVMGANIPSWTETAFGKRLTPKEFIANDKAQEAVFEHYFGGYLRDHGPIDAVSMWFSGLPLAKVRAGANDGYTSVPSYIAQYQTNLKNYKPEAQTAEVEGAVSPLVDLDKEFHDDIIAPILAEREAKKKAALAGDPLEIKPLPPSGASWGPVQELAQGALMQQAPKLSAAVAAGKEGLRDWMHGNSISEAYTAARDRYYPQAKAQYEGAREDWGKEHPGQEIAMNVAGGVAPALAGIGAMNSLISAGAQAVPRAVPAANFLMGTAGEGMGGLLGMGARTGSNLASGALQGMVSEAATGKDDFKQAGIAGAGINALMNPFLRAVTAPLRARAAPEVATAAENYLQAGGELPASSIIQGPQRKTVEALAGKGDVEAVEKFTQLLGDKIGAKPIMEALATKGLTPEVMAEAKETINRGFDSFAKNAQVTVDQQLMTDLHNVKKLAQRQLSTARPEAAQAVIDAVDHIEDVAMANVRGGNFIIGGKDFRLLTSSGSVIDNLFSADHNAVPFALKLKDTMYEALGRSMPEAKKEIDRLRQQYRDLIRLERVAPSGPLGLLNPKQVARKYGKSGDEFGQAAAMGAFLPAVDAAGNIAGREKGLVDMIFDKFAPHAGSAAVGGGLGVLAGEAGLSWLPQLAEHPLPTLLGLAGGAAGLGAKKAYGNFLRSPEYLEQVLRNSRGPQAFGLDNPLIAAGAPTLSTFQGVP